MHQQRVLGEIYTYPQTQQPLPFKVNGQLIKVANNYSEGNRIDISNLENGIYLIQLESESFSKTFKLVK